MANGLASVYITEQGGWHALSNREQVAQYLMVAILTINQPYPPHCKLQAVILFPEFILYIRL